MNCDVITTEALLKSAKLDTNGSSSDKMFFFEGGAGSRGMRESALGVSGVVTGGTDESVGGFGGGSGDSSRTITSAWLGVGCWGDSVMKLLIWDKLQPPGGVKMENY